MQVEEAMVMEDRQNGRHRGTTLSTLHMLSGEGEGLQFSSGKKRRITNSDLAATFLVRLFPSQSFAEHTFSVQLQ